MFLSIYFLLMDFCLYSPEIRNLLHAHFASRPSGLGSFPSPSCHTLGIIRANLYKLGHGNRGAVWVVPGIQHLLWGIMGSRVKSWLPCASIAIFSLYTTICAEIILLQKWTLRLAKGLPKYPTAIAVQNTPLCEKAKKGLDLSSIDFWDRNHMVLIDTQRCPDLC